mmetsp:Transcript_5828/g.8936  ORF Transcript_5828/g.8936 Transcript_5828/m.8936 type:complete len:163 (-) Transcript_5828:143-631(-)
MGTATRVVDFIIIILHCYFLWSCTMIETKYCAAPLSEDSEGLMKTTYDFSVKYNPLFLKRPRWLQIATCMSAYGLSVFYVVILVSFLLKLNLVRIPVLIFVGAKIYALFFYHIMEYTSELPPPDPVPYWGVEGPYFVSITLLLLRCAFSDPFPSEPRKAHSE